MPKWLQAVIVLWMAGVAVAAIWYLPPARDFNSPELARLIIPHVPCAMIAVLAYIVSMVYAIAYLTRPEPGKDIRSAASAGLGFVFTLLATITGMIFAYTQWGSAWNWDPRETSILMLLVVYAAYFALRGAVPHAVTRARVSAVYNLLAGAVMPFFVFVMPRLQGGLHPSDTLTTRSGLSLEYRIVLSCAMLGFIGIYIWLFRLTVRAQERRSTN